MFHTIYKRYWHLISSFLSLQDRRYYSAKELGSNELCCARSRYQGQGQVITSHTRVHTVGCNYLSLALMPTFHDDVIKWKHFPRNWPFVREIHRSPVNFPHKGQWRGTLMFSFNYAWINDWVNNREAGDLRRQHGHYDVIVMWQNTSEIFLALYLYKSCKLQTFEILSADVPRRARYRVWISTDKRPLHMESH